MGVAESDDEPWRDKRGVFIVTTIFQEQSSPSICNLLPESIWVKMDAFVVGLAMLLGEFEWMPFDVLVRLEKTHFLALLSLPHSVSSEVVASGNSSDGQLQLGDQICGCHARDSASFVGIGRQKR